MKRMIQYMGRQIVKIDASTIFPGTKDDVMLTLETEKQEVVFNLEHQRALTLGMKLIEKAIPNEEKRTRYIRQIIGDA